jgi:hypothetical protein
VILGADADSHVAALSGLIVAITGLVTAAAAAWHSLHTSGKVKALDKKVNGGPNASGGAN